MNPPTPPAPTELAERLTQGATALGQPLDELAHTRLLHFVTLLAHWNRAYNLTAVREPAAMIPRHLLDSLAVRPYLFGEHVLDLGTGAGLPGLPLAILEPRRHFWLLDSQLKKLTFVRQVILELGLENVETVQARIATYRPGRNFSTIVSRAVAYAHLQPVLQHGLLARPGRVLLMKGRDLSEVTRMPTDADLTLSIEPLRIPFLDAERHLLVLRSD
ncbi:16S rRNA (guanine(527)-N(7))-methyltransferase RsmG [Thiocapsa imhoffii]|uniref:16S rRNA (guanine(527)-N(7))-methyltransferase RsmG n=1 Tax=Thiocapsa imhoffii TaxID=382777 RepID=UPI0030B8A22F